MPHHRSRHAGTTLIEMAVVLSVLAVLAGAAVPTVSGIVGRGKVQRARQDCVAIKQALIQMLTDVRVRGIVHDGSVPRARQQPVHLLVSDGDTPEVGPDGGYEWAMPVDFSDVDFIENHLVRNRPGNSTRNAYSRWHGAYLTGPIGPDPWGNRYVINTRYLFSGHRYDVVVLSAGPDEEIDSRFTQDGFVPGDDDIICLVSSGTLTPTRPKRGGSTDKPVWPFDDDGDDRKGDHHD